MAANIDNPVMEMKYQRECCTTGSCAVATFKRPCCSSDKLLCHKNCGGS